MIRSLYDSALEPERWQSSLDQLGDLLGGCAIGASVQSKDRGAHWLAYTRFDPDCAKLLGTRYADAKSNPMVAVMRRLPAGKPFPRSVVKPKSDYFRSGLYNDVFRPQGLVHAGVACAYRSADAFVPLGIFRRSGQEDFGDPELSILAMILPHLERAIEVFLRLQVAGTSELATDEALDRLPSGVMVVGPDGRVGKLNRAADAILRQGDGLALRDGRLSANHPDDERALYGLIASVLGTVSGDKLGTGGWLAVARPSMARPLAVLVAQLPPSQRGRAGRLGALVFVSDPERQISPSAEALMGLFELTPTQAQVTLLLVRGFNLNEVANKLGITVNTARVHLKAILARTSTGRQADLVRLVLNSVASLSDGSNSTDTTLPDI